MKEWLDELDECKAKGFYFDIQPEAAGQLADDIRTVLKRVDALETFLREIAAVVSNPSDIDRAALVKKEPE